MTVVTESSKVTLFFELSLEDGQVVDTNFGKTPASFEFGDGNLLPEFEAVLLGLKAGDSRSFNMAPEKAFGAHNPSNVQAISRDQFEMDLEQGMVVSFADANKNELPGVIAQINEKTVEVDFNHPLAGRTLTYKIEIVEVEGV
ncbi:FKBP-type peptidyl-prolyl cis-trans isomerase [Marinomonas mediterranea]|jgi:FKBP-type peptidyl-prolyl cis-trans isomerases 2|uniref:Peptidyl-prolyl cis-trans isomerase n=1 Tax=Marinomonas mediterranea (strain ATCC 700492 / JCM 21426 / NBRC 103028 / MMB-1) TaxID=717774 RepID=F2JXV3_MARM1|nr:FKBP-type peptidyl-prolyl cis-trans isomerase [Marinomonas mediterranea]ADZ89602.1 peptidylprolyl isomerase FKBP-type [Marinomonas mediterranea MMB-1]WCN07694.1 peptidylprolyl isomerase [Marinomonas mediterranea]WCN11795.1 peptidylprolyl isomerase [Marinomonas mediterranea]WCN15844.1 peptidylprolyl isomerase [Marinomonas mediterranea MMB-1]